MHALTRSQTAQVSSAKTSGFRRLGARSSFGQSEATRGALIFHFLVPAEADTDSLRRRSWRGRILALERMIEKAFEKACKSLDRHPGQAKQTPTDVEKAVRIHFRRHTEPLFTFRVKAVKERANATETRLTAELDAMQERMQRIENALHAQVERTEVKQRVQLDAMQERMERIENNQQMQFEAVMRRLNEI